MSKHLDPCLDRLINSQNTVKTNVDFAIRTLGSFISQRLAAFRRNSGHSHAHVVLQLVILFTTTAAVEPQRLTCTEDAIVCHSQAI